MWSTLGQKRTARLVLGIVAFAFAIGYTYAAYQMPVGSLARPGAGMFPRVVGLVAAVISLAVVAESLLSTEKSDDLDLPRGRRLALVLFFFLGTVAFMLLLPVLGQYVTGALYLIAMIKVLGGTAWWRAILLGAVLSAAVAWIFINLLQVGLPVGTVFA